MSTIDILHKDAEPAETIERIHALLDAAGFHRDHERLTRKKAWERCHSCSVHFTDYPLRAANGKGLTGELAYASALAEFVERLQCRLDLDFRRAGNLHDLPRFVPARDRSSDEILADAPELVERDLRALRSLPGARFPCVPFVDVFGRRIVDLPFELLEASTGSNGMCAGNTPAEAISHGICEIFERHVIRLVAEGAVPGLPTVAAGDLPLGSPLVRQLLDEIHGSGIEVLVKDATLGGSLPVLAVVLLDRAAGTCEAAFGSDPVLDVALSRCLTEACQGVERVSQPMPRGRGGASPDIYNNPHLLLERLEPDVGPEAASSAFIGPARSARVLEFLLARTAALGRRLYIHDASALGFPSYFVYIEGLSQLRPVGETRLAFLCDGKERVRRTLFGIDAASREQIAAAGRTLFRALTLGSPVLEAHFEEDVLNAPVASWMGLRPLLAFMLTEAGAWDGAATVLAWPPPSLDEPGLRYPSRDRAQAFRDLLSAFCRLRGEGAAADVAARQLQEMFAGSELAAGIPALAAGDYAGFAAGGRPGTSRRFEGLEIPRCLSVHSCPSCPCRRACALDRWRSTARSLRRAAAPVRPQALLDFFAGVQG